MKPINFIKNGSAQKQKALRLWLLISTCSITTVLVALCILQLHQYFIQKSLHNEKQILSQHAHAYDTILAQMHAQQSEKATLQGKLVSLNQYSQQPKNPVELLKHIKATLKNNAYLESLSVHEKYTEIKIMAENTNSLMRTADALAQQPTCRNLSVTALENKDKGRMMAVLHSQNNQKIS